MVGGIGIGRGEQVRRIGLNVGAIVGMLTCLLKCLGFVGCFGQWRRSCRRDYMGDRLGLR
jgi:hypothetical protein